MHNLNVASGAGDAQGVDSELIVEMDEVGTLVHSNVAGATLTNLASDVSVNSAFAEPSLLNADLLTSDAINATFLGGLFPSPESFIPEFSTDAAFTIHSNNTHISSYLAFGVRPELPITPATVSQEDSYYLEYLFRTISPSAFSVAGTIFRSLWRAYEITFSHPLAFALRSSVLASAVIRSAYSACEQVPQHKYTHYLNNFLNSLRWANAESRVGEEHLFGLFFVIQNVRAESKHSALYEKYLDWFCKMMGQLNQQAKDSGRQFPLQHVWRLLLSFLRREYVYPSAPTLSIQKKDARLLAMHELDVQLVCNRNLGGRVNQYVGSSYYSEEERCRRLSRNWDIWDILSSLKARFRVAYYRHWDHASQETNFLFGKFVESIRAGRDGFERFQYLHKAFEVCSSSPIELTR